MGRSRDRSCVKHTTCPQRLHIGIIGIKHATKNATATRAITNVVGFFFAFCNAVWNAVWIGELEF